MIHERYYYDGDHICLAKPGDIKLSWDIIETKEALILLCDLSGVSSLLQGANSTISCKVNPIHHEVIIEGKRTLFYRRIVDVTTNKVSADCVNYTRESDGVVSIERDYGVFKRTFKVPPNYQKKPSLVHFEHGQLQIVFPLMKENDETTLIINT